MTWVISSAFEVIADANVMENTMDNNIIKSLFDLIRHLLSIKIFVANHEFSLPEIQTHYIRYGQITYLQVIFPFSQEIDIWVCGEVVEIYY